MSFLLLETGDYFLLETGDKLILEAAPIITAQPQDVTVGIGLTGSFFAASGSESAVTYQWYEVTAGLLTGETSSTLSITGSLANSGNQYYFIATNDDGTATSDSATLTVIALAIEPQVRMDRSRDGGRTFTDERWRSMGKIGEYNRRLIWRRNGRAHTTDMYRFTISDSVQVVGIQLTIEVK